MTYMRFRDLRVLPTLACVSLVSLLAACGMPEDGYYDANGNFVSTPGSSTTMIKHGHLPKPGKNPDYRANRQANDDNYRYTRRGYYDSNGYYIPQEDGLDIPTGMFPARGMCRVWFIDRLPSEQPSVESCDGIKSRVPAGAYVIYGG